MSIKLHALIHTYNAVETIHDTLESLIGRVDSILIMDGRWIGVDMEGLHSTDGTLKAIADFKKNSPVPVKVFLSPQLMNQYEARNFLLSYVPIGDWFLIIDADEILKCLLTLEEIKQLIKQNTQNGFQVGTRLQQVPYPTPRLMCKTKGLRWTRNHRYLEDNNGTYVITINVGEFPLFPMRIVHHKMHKTKAMSEVMNKYEEWLYRWELNEQSQT